MKISQLLRVGVFLLIIPAAIGLLVARSGRSGGLRWLQSERRGVHIAESSQKGREKASFERKTSQ